MTTKNKLFCLDVHSVLGFDDVLVSNLYADPVNCQDGNQDNQHEHRSLSVLKELDVVDYEKSDTSSTDNSKNAGLTDVVIKHVKYLAKQMGRGFRKYDVTD